MIMISFAMFINSFIELTPGASRSDLNRLVMDYLVTAGYPSAAANLAHEAEINVGSIESWSFPGAVDTVRARADIRNALLMGQVGKAISIINDVDSMVSHTFQ